MLTWLLNHPRTLEVVVTITILNILLAGITLYAFFPIPYVPLQLAVFSAVLLIPGVTLLRLIGIRGSAGELLGYAIAFGTAFMIFLGFAINLALPYFGIARPLQLIPFVLAFDGAAILLVILSLLCGVSYRIRLEPVLFTPLSLVFSIAVTTFPFILLFGTILLNNGGPNTAVLAGLLGIALYVIILLLFRRRLPEFVFSYSIFMVSLSLLYMYSARTPFLMGWDIQNEYRVFAGTAARELWVPYSAGDIYNATLAVTILPALISKILSIPDFYIFKYVYPTIFAFTSLAVYGLLRNYLYRVTAFLAAFFVVVQLSYVSMPSLARQEIAFMMFIFTLHALFARQFAWRVKSDVMLLLGAAMVLSHYSTSYVAVFLFIATYAAGLLVRLIYHFWKNHPFPRVEYNLHPLVIAILTVLTVFWYGYYTQASGNVENLLRDVLKNIRKIHTEEGRAQQSTITITGRERRSTEQDLLRYIEETTNRYRRDPDDYSFFDLELAKSYPVRALEAPKITRDPFFEMAADNTVWFVRQSIKVLMLLGLFYLTFMFVFKKRSVIAIEWLLMGYMYMLFIAMAIFIPTVSKHYNMERLYQQGLMLLALFPVIVFQLARPYAPALARYSLLSIIVIVYYFSHHGVVAQLFGGKPTVNLNNFGEEFGQYFIFETERASTRWYFKNKAPRVTVFADYHARLRLASQGGVYNIISDILPTILMKDAYVYATRKNHISGSVQITYRGSSLLYSYPSQMLQDHKNMIYSNGASVIYK